jgi:hypothetical protein
MLVGLGAAAGLAAATVSGALTLARRTETAERRLQHAAHVEDAQVRLLSGTPADVVAAARVAHLPEVRAAWIAGAVIGRTTGTGVGYVAIAAGPPRPRGLVTPVIVSGRPARGADEIEVVDGYARAFGLRTGSVVGLRLLTEAQAGRFQTGVGPPAGPTVRLRVAGVFRAAEAGQSLPVVGSPAFAARYGAYAGGQGVFVRLRPGTRSAFSAAVSALPGASTVGVTFPADDARPVNATAGVLSGGLVAFALVLALGALLAVGQAFARRADASAADQAVESALGLTAAQRTLARVVPALLPAALAAMLAAGGAAVAGVLAPPGALAPVEPHPGWAPNLALIVIAAAVTVVCVTALAAGAADAAGSARVHRVPVARAHRLPRTAWLLGGRRFVQPAAAGPRLSRRVGTVIGLAGVIGVAVFASSLHRLVATPSRWGWNGQFAVVDSRPAVDAQLAADPRARGVAVLASSVVDVDGQAVLAYAESDVKGTAGWTVISGRLPRASGELLLGEDVARRLGAATGAAVTLTEQRGPRRVRVVGTGVGPVLNNEALGDAVVVSPSDLTAAARAAPSSQTVIDGRASAPALARELAGQWELSPRSEPREVTDLAGLGRLPLVLALALVAIACAATAHELSTLAQEGARDLLVLRTLGLTGAQASAGFTVAGIGAALLALAVALPVGAAAGRLVWWAVARSHGVATDASFPVVAIVAAVPTAVAVWAVFGWLGARRALRATPLRALRTD